VQRLLRHLRARGHGRLRIIRLLPAAGPRLVLAALALNILGGVFPVAFILATSAVVGRVPAAVEHGLDSPEWASLRNALIAAGALFLLQQVVFPTRWAVGEAITWKIDDTLRERILAASFDPVGVGALEEQETLDTIGQIADPDRGVGFTPGGACAGLVMLIPRYVQWLLAAILLAVVTRWWVALAAAAGALIVRVGVRSGLGKLGAFEASYAPARRRREYFANLLIGAESAKEVRLFGLLRWVQERYRGHALSAVRPVWRMRRRVVYLPYAVSLPLAFSLSALATIVAARAAARGELTLGEMAFALQAIVLVNALGGFFWEADWQTEHGLRAYGALERFEEHAAEQRDPRVSSDDPDGKPRSEIRFEGVTFAYPGTDAAVLRGLDLTIPAGRSLAIVGLNGAGKTTLVKLLARLYEPQAGRITVDGVDIRAFPAAAWRRRLGAIFQDFVHYDLPVADNVAFGAAALIGDEGRVRSAIARAGAAELVDELPHGLQTTLSREYEDGAELSGGQWQRIAIARALMAVEGGASVLVLDEPTANLDVRAEAEFFERFLELTRGLTTILISHRFSTVRRAERIVVLEEGAVVEEGTHEQLLARRGRYAELFHLQAARFAEGEEDE
jgi:ATP-binding cassette, subfamily B, bacterial